MNDQDNLSGIPASSIQDAIEAIRVSHFCVIRNVDFDNGAVTPPFATRAIRGELIGLAGTLETSRLLIPKPSYPEDEEKRHLFHERFGWLKTPLSDGTMVRGVPAFGFDDAPPCQADDNGKTAATDLAIFGETYTVLWVCPPNHSFIVESLVQHIDRLLRLDDSPMARPPHYMDLYQVKQRPCLDDYGLCYLQNAFVARMCIGDGESDNEKSRHLYPQVIDDFAGRLALRKSCAISKREVLNRLLASP